MDLCVAGHSQALPGLKIPNTNSRLWRTGLEGSTAAEGAPEQPEHPSPEYQGPRSGPSLSDTLTSGNITIPRPHGRKTPELGSVLVVPAAPLCSRGAAEGDEGNLSSGRGFQEALDAALKGDPQRSTKPPGESIDLINLDPLTEPRAAGSGAAGLSAASSAYRGTLPLRSFPQGFSSLPPRPHLALNPFAQHLPQHSACSSPQTHYVPPHQNPFSPSVLGPRPGSYFHPQPQVQGLYRQHSFGSLTHPSVHGRLRSAFPHKETRSPLPSSASNSALSGLADSSAVSHASEGGGHLTQDPFADLLTMVKRETTPKETVADVRLKWETFE